MSCDPPSGQGLGWGQDREWESEWESGWESEWEWEWESERDSEWEWELTVVIFKFPVLIPWL